MWVEEPMLPECEGSLEVLARAARSIPVVTGERLTSSWEVKLALESGAVDIIQPSLPLPHGGRGSIPPHTT